MTSPARRRGFTLLELLIVVAIMMVVAATATPSILSAVAAYRLRTAASNVAGLMQRTRMEAVSDDRWYGLASGTASGNSFVYVDRNHNGALDAPAEAMVMLARGITVQTTGAPSLGSMNLDFTATGGLPNFNARGLPCNVSGGACVSPSLGGAQGWSGYVCYLRQDQALGGGPAWAAITISAAGRVRSWTWSGTSWN